MQAAAAGAGVDVRIVSGFRTMAEQERLYSCYVNCNCNSCNLAARPGTSNHQSGHALDLNTSSGGVLTWLNNNGARFGFSRTVPSEAWHWEWWGSASDYPSPCGGDQRCIDDPNFGGCSGTVVTRCDENNQVGSGDCGVFGASCSTAGGNPHCVNPSCSIEVGGEDGTFCVDGTDRLATCTQGQVSEGDCAFFGASCSEAGGAGHCVHYLCWSNLDGREDGTFCVDEHTLGSCALGVPSTSDCTTTGSTCVENNGSATCSVPGAPAMPVEPEEPTGEGEGEEEDEEPAANDDDDDDDDFAPSVTSSSGCSSGGFAAGQPVLLGLLLLGRKRLAKHGARFAAGL
jgi:hypothetical protein